MFGQPNGSGNRSPDCTKKYFSSPHLGLTLLEVREIDVGSMVGEKYELLRKLSGGGTGEVFLALHREGDMKVAIKILPQKRKSEGATKRTLNEFRTISQLQSENIVRALDAGVTTSGSPYLVTEFLLGEDLASLLKRRKRLDPAEAIDYVLEACIGLAAAHRVGIVHRDIKPANIFIAEPTPGDKCVKILDFGLAKDLQAMDSTTKNFSMLGTPTHLSPEQLRDAKNVDARTDVWAMGVTLYEMITGALPFTAENPARYFAAIVNDPPYPFSHFGIEHDGIEKVLRRALEKDPENRIGSIEAFAVLISRYGSSRAETLVDRVENEALTAKRLPIVAPPSAGALPPHRSKGPKRKRLEKRKQISPWWYFLGVIGLALVGFLLARR